MPEEFDPAMPEEGAIVPAEEPQLPEELNDFASAGVDPTRLITIATTSGRPAYVELQAGEAAIPFSAAIQRAGLLFNGQLNVYMNGQEVAMETPIPGGATVTVVGNVKGGAC